MPCVVKARFGYLKQIRILRSSNSSTQGHMFIGLISTMMIATYGLIATTLSDP